MEQIIKTGIHKFSGISAYSERQKYDWYDRDGYLFVLDDITYKAVTDPDDGYRSYGRLEKCPNANCSNKFPPQDVLVTYTEDNGWMYEFKNINTGDTILKIGTDYADGYYPMSIMSYYPENMPINQAKVKPNSVNVLNDNFTTPEQSKKLLELGVPADSADCYYTQTDIEGNMYWFEINIKREYQPHPDLHSSVTWGPTLPCWSVGRLMNIMLMCVNDNYAALHFIPADANHLIEEMIKCFERHIENFDFSNLEEQYEV